MAETPRIDRKGIKKDDLFVAKGRNLLDSALRHRTRFVPLAILAGVVLASVALYQWWDSRQMEKSWATVHKVMNVEEAKRWDEMKKLYGELPNGRPKFFLAVSLADHYFADAKKQYEADPKTVPPSSAVALEWYDKALSFGQLLPAERQLLLVDKGSTFELQKQWDQALAQYEAGRDAATTYKALGMLGVARVTELKGDKAKAMEAFEKVSTDFASTEYGKLARNHLRRLKSSFLGESKS